MVRFLYVVSVDEYMVPGKHNANLSSIGRAARMTIRSVLVGDIRKRQDVSYDSVVRAQIPGCIIANESAVIDIVYIVARDSESDCAVIDGNSMGVCGARWVGGVRRCADFESLDSDIGVRSPN